MTGRREESVIVIADAGKNIVVGADGVARLGGLAYRCALGSAGLVDRKVEGDNGTPVGAWPLRRILFRPDREAPPASVLPVSPITPSDGWCDDPRHRDYNRPVVLPFEATHEIMWRDDHLYDLVVVIGHNDDPPRPDAGSAIFLHLATGGFAPTAGCIAFARADLLEILSTVEESSLLIAGH